MSSVKVVGLGSPQGDDQAAWQVVERLRAQLTPTVEASTIVEPTRLLDVLEGCTKLVLIDACRSGQPPGSIIRLEWPQPALQTRSGFSSHGLGVGAVLKLAENLGQLPLSVVLFGIEVQDCQPGNPLSQPVCHSLGDLCQQVLEEVTREQGESRTEFIPFGKPTE
jgi:hydrogenase maturation protease